MYEYVTLVMTWIGGWNAPWPLRLLHLPFRVQHTQPPHPEFRKQWSQNSSHTCYCISLTCCHSQTCCYSSSHSLYIYFTFPSWCSTHKPHILKKTKNRQDGGDARRLNRRRRVPGPLHEHVQVITWSYILLHCCCKVVHVVTYPHFICVHVMKRPLASLCISRSLPGAAHINPTLRTQKSNLQTPNTGKMVATRDAFVVVDACHPCCHIAVLVIILQYILFWNLSQPLHVFYVFFLVQHTWGHWCTIAFRFMIMW